MPVPGAREGAVDTTEHRIGPDIAFTEPRPSY
jgi:hypothetical protein